MPGTSGARSRCRSRYTFNENVAFKVYGAVGNQYVERFTNYGIGYNNYWDWQIGFTATVYGVDLTIAYIDTNLDVPSLRQHHELRRPRRLHHQQDVLTTVIPSEATPKGGAVEGPNLVCRRTKGPSTSPPSTALRAGAALGSGRDDGSGLRQAQPAAIYEACKATGSISPSWAPA